MPTKSKINRRKSNSGNKNQFAGNKQTTIIKIRNINNNRGKIEIVGGDVKTYYINKGLSGNEIERLFDKMYSELEVSAVTSPTIKREIQKQVKEIQSLITQVSKKNEKVDEKFLARRFRNIAQMAPDILDLVAKTLASPILGITDLVNKIAKKAKEKTQSS